MREVTKSRHGKELDLAEVVVADDARNTQAPFHVKVGQRTVCDVQENLFVQLARKTSRPRDVQDFQCIPEVGWEIPPPRVMWYQKHDASFEAEIFHCRTSSEEACEAPVRVPASLELERHQIVQLL